VLLKREDISRTKPLATLEAAPFAAVVNHLAAFDAGWRTGRIPAVTTSLLTLNGIFLLATSAFFSSLVVVLVAAVRRLRCNRRRLCHFYRRIIIHRRLL